MLDLLVRVVGHKLKSSSSKHGEKGFQETRSQSTLVGPELKLYQFHCPVINKFSVKLKRPTPGRYWVSRNVVYERNCETVGGSRNTVRVLEPERGSTGRVTWPTWFTVQGLTQVTHCSVFLETSLVILSPGFECVQGR